MDKKTQVWNFLRCACFCGCSLTMAKCFHFSRIDSWISNSQPPYMFNLGRPSILFKKHLWNNKVDAKGVALTTKYMYKIEGPTSPGSMEVCPSLPVHPLFSPTCWTRSDLSPFRSCPDIFWMSCPTCWPNWSGRRIFHYVASIQTLWVRQETKALYERSWNCFMLHWSAHPHYRRGCHRILRMLNVSLDQPFLSLENEECRAHKVSIQHLFRYILSCCSPFYWCTP